MWMKTRRTHGAILCVCGERKWTLSTTTVTQMLRQEKQKKTDKETKKQRNKQT